MDEMRLLWGERSKTLAVLAGANIDAIGRGGVVRMASQTVTVFNVLTSESVRRSAQQEREEQR